MNIKRPFAPHILDRLDNYLLLNKPLGWSTRAHLVIFYSLVFISATTVICFLVPDDPRGESYSYVWSGMLGVISGIAVIGWLIYLLRFNVFKRFGVFGAADFMAEFLLYFVSILFLTCFWMIPMAVETTRANNEFPDKVLAKDIDDINIKICQLEYDSLPHQWSLDTLLVQDTLPEPLHGRKMKYVAPAQQQGLFKNLDSIIKPGSSIEIIDTSVFRAMQGDSLVMINDSLYKHYKVPDYVHLPDEGVADYSDEIVLGDKDLYYKVIQNYQRPDMEKTRKEVHEIWKKYYLSSNEKLAAEYDMVEVVDGSGAPVLMTIQKKYELATMEKALEHITERKYRWLIWGGGYAVFTFYLALILALLVFVFRHSTAKTFFLSLLTGLVLFILMLLITAFIGFGSYQLLWWPVAYFIVFTVIACFVFNQWVRNVVTGIAMNLFVMMLSFMPTTGVSIYIDWLQRQYQSRASAYLQLDYDRLRDYMTIAQIAGPVILLILLPTFIYQLYRRWYALPEQ